MPTWYQSAHDICGHLQAHCEEMTAKYYIKRQDDITKTAYRMCGECWPPRRSEKVLKSHWQKARNISGTWAYGIFLNDKTVIWVYGDTEEKAVKWAKEILEKLGLE